MKTYTLFKQYCWLVDTIREAGKISLPEINRKWLRTELSEGVEISRQTFIRHKREIESMFGIFIECDEHDGYKYYIGNPEDLKSNTVQNWMLSTITVNNILSESISLNNRILLESIPYNNGYLEKVIRAIKTNVRINIEYQKYGSDAPRPLTFDPYALKMHNRRWYILAHFNSQERGDYYGTFSFDRIKSLELTEEKFEIKEGFSAEEYFSECFGIVHGDGTPVMRIVVRAFDKQRYYMRDLPWHHSQKEIAVEEDYSDFEYMLRPSIDFTNHILGMGNTVKVLEPEWLADEVHDMHLAAQKLYLEDY